MSDSCYKLSDMTTNLDKWQAGIQRIKRELLDLGEMRPGALSRQFNVCGKPGCRCKDKPAPKKHGPYYQISYTHLGKSTSEFVKRDQVPAARKQLANYARFKRLTQEWVVLSLRVARARRRLG
jgi:hypothetical protein